MTALDTQDHERRRHAIARLRKRAEFRTHLAAYVLVNAVIITVWYMTAGGGLFWPIFPLLGWGIGLFFHGMDAYRRPLSEARIHKEMQRLGSDDASY